ncbi:uncharacterized protein LOC108166227 [Poecilia reticulata]|uniref:uncharacterized protein LOC108166227 n=1 Tax=Poecilia reticulata TaxID=8081 RepID=UPI0007EB7AAF|nr:PREDICTED: uncharacterized protein LOC108166227 [Poecilia reticulata]XP_017159829.1 PREDICTED: uncharacterized protein LOC108166227 [Poecilia reticulata]
MTCQRKFYSLLVVVVVLDLVSGLSLVTSSSQNLESKANYSCYSCPLSEAQFINTVYNKHTSKGDFWYRNGSALASCDFSSIYESKRKCSVCVKQAESVVMVLCNLTSGEELLFEGQHGEISFNRTNCPQPEHIGVTEPNSDGHIILVVCLLTAFIIVIMSIMWKRHKSQKTPADGSSTNSSDPESGSESTDMVKSGLAEESGLLVTSDQQQLDV